jgi:hypothetical protein
MTSFWVEPDTVSIPLISGLNLSPVSGAPFDKLVAVGVGVTAADAGVMAAGDGPSELLLVWLSIKPTIVPIRPIIATPTPPYAVILAADTGSPESALLCACDGIAALPPYAELVVIVVLPRGVFDRTDRRGVTHIDIGALRPNLTCT